MRLKLALLATFVFPSPQNYVISESKRGSSGAETMKDVATKTFEWILNIVSVLSLVLILWIVGQRLFMPSSQVNSDTKGPQVGARVSLSGINWALNHASLIMVLQIGCHFCEESIGFYDQLIASNSNNKFHPIAVFPQKVEDAQLYLRMHNLEVSDVRQADFGALGVVGTPTLILVDDAGIIRASWTGKLSPDQEEQVFKKLDMKLATLSRRELTQEDLAEGSDQTAEAGLNLLGAPELVGLINDSVTIPIVDTRPRPVYASGHILGALNIPLDELNERAPHEVPMGVDVVVYCHYASSCEVGARKLGAVTPCTSSVKSLGELGFTKVRIVNANLLQLRNMGVSVGEGEDLGAREK
jgi:hypothetical protein